MSESLQYRTIGDERIILHRDDQPIGPPLQTVAVCFDRDGGVLHKHGKPEAVRQWYEQTRRKFIDAGHADMVEDLVVIEAAFPVEELNKMLHISGYVGVYCKRLMLEAGQ